MLSWGMNVICRHCGSDNIVRKGARKLLCSTNQRYLCTNCGKQFSFREGRHDAVLMLDAVRCYNAGKTLAQVVKDIRKERKLSVTPMTISRWVRRFDAGFLRIRTALLKRCRSNLITSKQFVHSGLIYQFSVHNGKLDALCAYPELSGYLAGLDNRIDRYFSAGKRCSQLNTVKKIEVREKRDGLCKAVGHVLPACSELKERHSALQSYLLHNDDVTIATEVPVYLWDKQLGAISGHIDILQIRDGKVMIVDYKPGAAFLPKEKVVSQLFWYARALSFRAKIDLRNMSCLYFDEQVCFEFEPAKVKLDYGGGQEVMPRNVKPDAPGKL